jgi:sulfotransferase family protein
MDNSMVSPGPIFVGGASRSGKTLVRWMLSSTPRIVVTSRTGMWPRFYGRFGDLGRSDNFDRCVDAMLARKQIAALTIDVDRLRRDFRRGPPTYARLFALVHEQYAERCGKSRWGDQTGLIERFADEIASAYPGARVIHMIRDPRDRHVALRDSGPHRALPVGESTASWLLSAALARRNVQRHPSTYKLVRYETLVTQLDATMRDVCAFIDEEFDPTMLTMDSARRYRAQREAAIDGRPISAAYVGQYRGSIGRRDLAFIQSVAHRQMIAFDYTPDPIRLSARERVHFAAVDWPINLARIGSWRAVDALFGRPRAPIGYLVGGR